MARSRNIKPGFFTNDVLGELPALTRLLFAGLWIIADREGRIEDRPKKIRAEVLPYDQCDADEMLQALENNGFVLRYESCGVKVIQVLAWDKHQNPHVKEAPSTLPAYTEHQTSTVQEQCSEQPLPERAGLIPDSLLLIPDSLKDSVAKATGGKPPLTPDEIIFGYGLPILTNAGTPEKQARSFLGGLRKAHGDDALVNTLRECIRAKPLQPLEWLAKAMPPDSTGTASKRETFAERDAKNARKRWEEMTGQQHPDSLPKNITNVIDSQILELSHDQSH